MPLCGDGVVKYLMTYATVFKNNKRGQENQNGLCNCCFNYRYL